MSLMHYVLLFFIYSFLGWVVEVLDFLIEDHKLTNRGFLIGPYCPIYGCGCLLFIFLLSDSSNDYISLFLKAIIICSVLEYFTSYIMEKIFKTRWWDYSNKKFNINGRICLETMIPFGILGCLVMYIINPFFTSILLKIDINIINVLGFLAIFILFTDFIISFKIIFNIRNVIRSVAIDNTDEITKRVRDILNKSSLYRRFVKAFPKFKISKLFKIRR